jgi:pyridoxamine 5'-phosphate oxidase
MTVANLRREYARLALDQGGIDPDPVVQFAAWFRDAQAAGIDEPNAMTLTTATPDGMPSARIVLLKGFDERGFVFYSNHRSQKGQELGRNPRAALVFFWPPLERQVRIAGSVSHLPREASERYFRSRPRGSQIGASVSRQSTVIPSRAALDQAVAAFLAAHEAGEIPMPPDWGGYRVLPEIVEFWQGRAGRLHDRLRYVRHPGGWRVERLAT